MAVNYNPSVVSSNLLVYYDASNTQNSWRGAPTTNFVATVPYPLSTYAYASGPITVQSVPNESGVLTTVSQYTVANVINSARAAITPAITVGQSYIFSCKIKYNGTNTASPVFEVNASKGFPEAGGANTLTVSQTQTAIGNGWYYVIYTFTVLASPTNAAILTFGIVTGADTAYLNKTFDVYDVKLQFYSQDQPLAANVSRSNTQALLNLINPGTTTLTATSLSYNTDNTFSFLESASNTVVSSIPVTAIPALPGWTLECVVKITAFPTGGATIKQGVLIGAMYYCGGSIYWSGNLAGTAIEVVAAVRGLDAARSTAPFTLVLNTWYMLTAVQDAAAGKLSLYVNGALFSEVTGATQQYDPTFTGIAGNIGVNRAQIYAGGTNTYSYVTGIIPVARAYNQPLTALQVAQNFQAQRSRYGI